jgi:hypothetical protein
MYRGVDFDFWLKVRKASLTSPLLIEKLVPSQESERSYIGAVRTVWYILFTFNLIQ